ncbi:MAG: hypothetical protein GX846_01965, partial [Deltaproteobacteria bacterium]|nr:hypothetical protein [Deltaproteobacteria bacterium]
MARKRIINSSIVIFLSILIIGLGLISCFYLFVPGYVEKNILPPLLKKNSIALLHLNVRSIGPGGAE